MDEIFFSDNCCIWDHLSACFSWVFPLCTTTTKSLQLCPTLWDPMDGSPPGSPASGILQARTLEWVAISLSKVSSQSRIKTAAPALVGGFFTTDWPGVNQKLFLWKLSWAMEKILFMKTRTVISMGINSCCIWVVRDYCCPGLWWDPDAHEKVWNEVSERRLRS